MEVDDDEVDDDDFDEDDVDDEDDEDEAKAVSEEGYHHSSKVWSNPSVQRPDDLSAGETTSPPFCPLAYSTRHR